jgi:hypothetical protein
MQMASREIGQQILLPTLWESCRVLLCVVTKAQPTASSDIICLQYDQPKGRAGAEEQAWLRLVVCYCMMSASMPDGPISPLFPPFRRRESRQLPRFMPELAVRSRVLNRGLSRVDTSGMEYFSRLDFGKKKIESERCKEGESNIFPKELFLRLRKHFGAMADGDLSDEQLKQLLKDAELRLREAKPNQAVQTQDSSLPSRFVRPLPRASRSGAIL